MPQVGVGAEGPDICPQEFVAPGLQQYHDEIPQIARIDGDNITASPLTSCRMR